MSAPSLVALRIKDGVLSRHLKNELMQLNRDIPGKHQLLNLVPKLVEGERWLNQIQHANWLIDEVESLITKDWPEPLHFERDLKAKVEAQKSFRSSLTQTRELSSGDHEQETFDLIVERDDWSVIQPGVRYSVGRFEAQDSIGRPNYLLIDKEALELRESNPELFARMMKSYIRYFSVGWAAPQGEAGLKQLRLNRNRRGQSIFEIRIMRHDLRIIGSLHRNSEYNMWQFHLVTDHVDSYGALLRRLGW